MGDEKKEKQIMLTNLSESKFVTKQGDFYPGTAKEFGETEALKLLQYSTEIKRTEDALKNPKIKNKITNLEKEIAAKNKEIKDLKIDIAKGMDGKVLDDLKGKSAMIAELEKKLTFNVALEKELKEAIAKHIADKEAISEEKDKEIKQLKKELKEAQKK